MTLPQDLTERQGHLQQPVEKQITDDTDRDTGDQPGQPATAEQQTNDEHHQRRGDRRLHFLRGRILLQRGRLDEASQSFARALATGMAADDVLPYQAELAFLRRDYPQVRGFLGRINPWARRNPPLSDIAEYWL